MAEFNPPTTSKVRSFEFQKAQQVRKGPKKTYDPSSEVMEMLMEIRQDVKDIKTSLAALSMVRDAQRRVFPEVNIRRGMLVPYPGDV